MKKINLFIVLTILLLQSCQNSEAQSSKTDLNPNEFNAKMKASTNPIILDVRTPEEFAGGYIENAKNINYNSPNFINEVKKFPKDQPIFVYCLSGGRSGLAADQLRSMGYKDVFELEGGMMQWRNANLPEIKAKISQTGMSMQDFQQFVKSDKLVLVDFYAPWCGPCKKMKPFLDEIQNEMISQLEIKKVDVDQNTELATELKIESIPLLVLYKNGEVVWSNIGFLEKDKLVSEIKRFL
jgi:thioredoxin 1